VPAPRIAASWHGDERGGEIDLSIACVLRESAKSLNFFVFHRDVTVQTNHARVCHAPMDETLNNLEQLYRETGPALLTYFRRQPALAAVAEDLLQDTFMRALQRTDRLQASVSQRAYLFGIARHVGLDALRRRRPTEELAAESAATAPAEDDRLEPLRGAIAGLPALQREALLLKLQHELSYEEIAEVLAIPVGTVRSRLHHAVRRLRETINPRPPSP
jgi:RNA polymerase sigma-70 factor (ECF subfamily)